MDSNPRASEIIRLKDLLRKMSTKWKENQNAVDQVMLESLEIRTLLEDKECETWKLKTELQCTKEALALKVAEVESLRKVVQNDDTLSPYKTPESQCQANAMDDSSVLAISPAERARIRHTSDTLIGQMRALTALLQNKDLEIQRLSALNERRNVVHRNLDELQLQQQREQSHIERHSSENSPDYIRIRLSEILNGIEKGGGNDIKRDRLNSLKSADFLRSTQNMDNQEYNEFVNGVEAESNMSTNEVNNNVSPQYANQQVETESTVRPHPLQKHDSDERIATLQAELDNLENVERRLSEQKKCLVSDNFLEIQTLQSLITEEEAKKQEMEYLASQANIDLHQEIEERDEVIRSLSISKTNSLRQSAAKLTQLDGKIADIRKLKSEVSRRSSMSILSKMNQAEQSVELTISSGKSDDLRLSRTNIKKESTVAVKKTIPHRISLEELLTERFGCPPYDGGTEQDMLMTKIQLEARVLMPLIEKYQKMASNEDAHHPRRERVDTMKQQIQELITPMADQQTQLQESRKTIEECLNQYKKMYQEVQMQSEVPSLLTRVPLLPQYTNHCHISSEQQSYSRTLAALRGQYFK